MSTNDDAAINLFDTFSPLLYQCLPLNTALFNTSLFYYKYDDIMDYLTNAPALAAIGIYVFFGVELLADILRGYFSVFNFLPNHMDMFNFF